MYFNRLEGKRKPSDVDSSAGHTCYLEWPSGLEDDVVRSSALPELQLWQVTHWTVGLLH